MKYRIKHMYLRIGMLILTAGLMSTASVAQDVSFTVSSKQLVQEGERFRVVFNANTQAKSFRGPDFSGFNVLSGPSTSSSSNIQIINGQMTQSVNYSYTYIIEAVKEGAYTVGAASLEADGKTYQTKPFEIKVVKGTPPPQGGNRQQGSQQPSSGGVSGEDLYIRAIASKTDPYLGEEVIITFNIYTRVRISLPNYPQQPVFPGFWSTDLLKDAQSLSQSRQVINGNEYIVVEYKKFAIYPQKSGEIVLEPFEMDIIAQVAAQRRSTGDPFQDFFNNPFFRNYQNVEKKIRSNEVRLRVKPLPQANRPSDFSGMVGRYSMESNIDRSQLKVNEALNLKLNISGKGNIDLIGAPSIAFPTDFETYDPKISGGGNIGPSGVSGSKSFEYLLIPRAAGEHVIKPVRFSYFDPDKEEYVVLSSPEFTINVERGIGEDASSMVTSVNKEDVKYIGSDIRYLKTAPFILYARGDVFFGSTLYILLMLLPLVLFIGLFLYLRRRARITSNVALMKNRKATRVARNRLKSATRAMKTGNRDLFYIELTRALWGYLSDKFNIPPSSLSAESAREQMISGNIPDDTAKEFLEVLNQSEFERFAPGSGSQEMQDLFDRGINIIKKMERSLR